MKLELSISQCGCDWGCTAASGGDVMWGTRRWGAGGWAGEGLGGEILPLQEARREAEEAASRASPSAVRLQRVAGSRSGHRLVSGCTQCCRGCEGSEPQNLLAWEQRMLPQTTFHITVLFMAQIVREN